MRERLRWVLGAVKAPWKVKKRWIVGMIAGATISVGGFPAAINRDLQLKAAPKTYRDVAKVPERYTAIVLGAFANGDEPSDVLEDRLQTALELYQARRVQRILVSGDHGREDYNEVRAMRLWLVQRGVPSDVIFMDHAGFRTHDTMTRAAQVFQVRDAIVVTQEFHLARSLFLAASAGIDAIGIIADKRRYAYAKSYAQREYLARVRSWIDVKLAKKPRYLGAMIPITGRGSATHDASTPP